MGVVPYDFTPTAATSALRDWLRCPPLPVAEGRGKPSRRILSLSSAESPQGRGSKLGASKHFFRAPSGDGAKPGLQPRPTRDRRPRERGHASLENISAAKISYGPGIKKTRKTSGQNVERMSFCARSLD